MFITSAFQGLAKQIWNNWVNIHLKRMIFNFCDLFCMCACVYVHTTCPWVPVEAPVIDITYLLIIECQKKWQGNLGKKRRKKREMAKRRWIVMDVFISARWFQSLRANWNIVEVEGTDLLMAVLKMFASQNKRIKEGKKDCQKYCKTNYHAMFLFARRILIATPEPR